MCTNSPVTYVQSADSSISGMFFTSLFKNKQRADYCSGVLAFTKETSLEMVAFPKTCNSYSRTIVARQQDGFEAILVRWDRGVAGLVHGHPDYAFYHLLQGRLGVEHFKLGVKGPELVTSCIMEPGDHFCVEGVAGRFDNAIHRITALEESLSVHMYSDDALLGTCYREYPDCSPFLEKQDESCALQGRI